MHDPKTLTYTTAGGVRIERSSSSCDYRRASLDLAAQLDSLPGVLLSSRYEHPGRYSHWDLGCIAPPLRIECSDRSVRACALNERGAVLLQMIATRCLPTAEASDVRQSPTEVSFTLPLPPAPLFEEQRMRQISVFTFLRRIIALFASTDDPHLGLYGAFGYELAFQFEPIQRRQSRDAALRDMVLYLPDRLLIVDHRRESAEWYSYEFSYPAPSGAGRISTHAQARENLSAPFEAGSASDRGLYCDHTPGRYAHTVRTALSHFARGDLFEVVPSQTFHTPCSERPSQIFERLQQQNPAPYGALLNLGRREYLVAASPEMFVRVEGRRVESCPISGTVARGGDALEDADQIRTLLNSAKDEAELSMCTDVDRNDKARVCVPGSIHILARREIERYSRVIHTVDHVEGRLREDCDALDAFLAHTWAVTVTGAPKPAAMQFIEDHEISPRRWYGGALGCLNFNGNLNTGLTIRTIHIDAGIAKIRAGATVLCDSEPEAEERETRLKAAALLAAINPVRSKPQRAQAQEVAQHRGVRVLVVDHKDSFAHNLGSYLQICGADVKTTRVESVSTAIAQANPDIVVLSPGPGRPADHAMGNTLRLCLSLQVPVFGVCLGLQGIVEYFGGTLTTLPKPMHGQRSVLEAVDGPLFAGINAPLLVGRYHSLIAERVPACLKVCARTDDQAVMAVMHRQLPIAAVQFHPESILSLQGALGQRLLGNALTWLLNRRTSSPQ